ncbi:MAG: hypothetical protein HUU26_05425 [Gemmatimonadaceae bacterium]|nr:hypothetical protein [Gemmatimonadaceae bacterium]
MTSRTASGGRAGNNVSVGLWVPQGAGDVYPTVGLTGWTGGTLSFVGGAHYILPKNGGDGVLMATFGLGIHTR